MADDLPLPREYFHPILRVLADYGAGLHLLDIYERTADLIGLTEEQRALRLPSHNIRKYRHRMGWCMTMLRNLGYVDIPERGLRVITEAGRQFLAEHPNGLSRDEQLALARLSNQNAAERQAGEEPSPKPAAEVEGTPEERIDSAIREHHEAIGQEILEALRSASPSFFERVVLDVLHAMGYGAQRSDVHAVGGSGDGGIDGIISLDRLGLEKVYVQAKRYAEGNTVGRPAIQAFFGALAGRRASKGVFITTSTFSSEAHEFAKSVSDSIVLVDGPALAKLMIEYGVGVTVRRTVRLVEFDSDYFGDA